MDNNIISHTDTIVAHKELMAQSQTCIFTMSDGSFYIVESVVAGNVFMCWISLLIIDVDEIIGAQHCYLKIKPDAPCSYICLESFKMATIHSS